MAGFNDLKLGFDSLTYMQDMTTAKCEAASVYETKQLIDNRDSKKYWVTKLQDGNCWMSQNLDLDLSKSKALTTANTDITSNWTPTNDTQTGSPSFTTDNSTVQSYNPGEYVYATPSVQRNCGTVSALSACDNYAWTSIAGLTQDTDPNLITKMEDDAVSGNKYDSHYLIGNYYSFAAATAGYTGSATAPSSICPKGWQLPVNDGTNTNAKSYYALLQKYGVNSSLTSTVTTTRFDIRLSPLFFVYGGNVPSSSLEYAGDRGYYWSSMALTASYAYTLTFSTSVYPSSTNGNYGRYFGYSVRCVAR